MKLLRFSKCHILVFAWVELDEYGVILILFCVNKSKWNRTLSLWNQTSPLIKGVKSRWRDYSQVTLSRIRGKSMKEVFSFSRKNKRTVASLEKEKLERKLINQIWTFFFFFFQNIRKSMRKLNQKDCIS